MWQNFASWTVITVLLSILTSVVGLALAITFIVRMPRDHFLHRQNSRRYRHPALHICWICSKNAFGLTIIVLGVAMSVLPGPGLLAILLGLSIVDIPGRHKLIDYGLQLNSVRRTLNWIRRKASRPPLEFPPHPTSPGSDGESA